MKLKSSVFSTVASWCVMAMVLSMFTGCSTDDVALIDEPDPTEEGLVYFDFTDNATLTAFGIAIPANGSGTPIQALTKGIVTITPTNAAGANPIRIWATNSGVLDLRVYTGDALTISLPEGYIITKLSWTSANADNIDAWSPNTGSISGGVWTAEEGKTYDHITLTATATTRINLLSVGYEKGQANTQPGGGTEPEPEPDPVVPVDVSVDFTSSSVLTALGIEIPANGAGTPISSAITVEQFTVTPTNAEGVNPVRIWATNSGVLDLRIYSGDALTYSVPKDSYIKALSWTSANSGSIDSWTPSAGTLSNGVWTAPEGEQLSSVTFTATGTTRINVLSATYGKRAR